MNRPTRARGPAAAPGDLVLDQPSHLVVQGRWRLLLTGWLVEALPEPDHLAAAGSGLAGGPALAGGPDLVEDIVLAVDEAVSNAVEHAYRGHHSGAVTLCARAGPGATTVTVEVGDQGRWRPAPDDPGHRGRGLPMIGALAGHVELIRTATGTTVTMTWTTPGPGQPRAQTR